MHLHFRAILIIFVTVVAGLSPEVSAHAEGRPFKAGIILPLSGPLAAMGNAFRKGVELYAGDKPAFGAAAVLAFEDHRYDGKAAVSAFHKLREADKVDFTVVWGNTPSGTCAPIAERMKAPLLALSFNPDAKGRKFVVTFGPRTERLVGKVADQFQEWGVKEPAAVSIDIGNALLALEMLKKQLKGRLTIRLVANEETDFKSIITGLRTKGSGGLFLLTLPDQALTFIRQAIQLNYRPKIIGGDVFAEDTFRKAAVAELPNLSFVYGAVEQGFIKRVQDRWGDTSYFFETACGYAVAAMIDELAIDELAIDELAIDELAGDKTKGTNTDWRQTFRQMDLGSLPVPGLKLLEDDDYGTHFETDSMVYPASAG